jgi:hypothetical protein
MEVSTPARDEAAQQLVNDRNLIDHLVQTFHAESDRRLPQERVAQTYEQVRREWPHDVVFGTRLHLSRVRF